MALYLTCEVEGHQVSAVRPAAAARGWRQVAHMSSFALLRKAFCGKAFPVAVELMLQWS